MNSAAESTSVDGMKAFERTTSRWGRITMIAGLVLSLAGPLYLVLAKDLGVTLSQVVVAYGAVAGAFLIFAVVEPLTYFPIVGQAAMYQAFMIGNIANKLLPAAIVAQDAIGVRPGTRKADLSAVMAICGAAMVHVASLLIFVGLLGTWLLSLIPPAVTEVARLYILPAILGAVLVQVIAAVRQPRVSANSIVVSLGLLFLVIPLAPGLRIFGTGLAVLLTVLLAWVLRRRTSPVVGAP